MELAEQTRAARLARTPLAGHPSGRPMRTNRASAALRSARSTHAACARTDNEVAPYEAGRRGARQSFPQAVPGDVRDGTRASSTAPGRYRLRHRQQKLGSTSPDRGWDGCWGGRPNLSTYTLGTSHISRKRLQSSLSGDPTPSLAPALVNHLARSRLVVPLTEQA